MNVSTRQVSKSRAASATGGQIVEVCDEVSKTRPTVSNCASDVIGPGSGKV